MFPQLGIYPFVTVPIVKIKLCDAIHKIKKNVTFKYQLSLWKCCSVRQLFSVKQMNPLGIRFGLFAFPLLCPTHS